MATWPDKTPPPYMKFLFHTIEFGPGRKPIFLRTTVQKRKPHIEIINSWKTIHRNEEIEKSCASSWKLTKWHFGSSIRSPAYYNTNLHRLHRRSLYKFSPVQKEEILVHMRGWLPLLTRNC